MSKRCFAAVVGAALVWCATMSPTAAGPLPGNALDGDSQAWFYNKPAVPVADYKADMNYCRELAGKMTSGSTTAISINPVAALIATAVVAAMDASQDAGRRNAFADDCMVAHGYRRFDLPDGKQKDFRARVEGMDDTALAALVAAETPGEGTLAREWVNSFQRASADPAVVTPAFAQPKPAAMTYPPRQRLIAAAKIEKDVPVAAGEVILVGSIRNAAEATGNHSIVLTRIDPATGVGSAAPSGPRQRVAVPVLTMLQNASRAKGRENVDAPRMHVFAVPAGHYALTAYSSGMQGVQMCLRTIAFEAKAGEVLHVGDWVSQVGASDIQAGAVVSAALLVPNPNIAKVTAAAQLGLEGFDLDAGRVALARAPAGSAENLAPVTWMNGAAYPCQPVAGAMIYGSIYGYDMPGAAALNAVAAAAPVVAAAPAETIEAEATVAATQDAAVSADPTATASVTSAPVAPATPAEAASEPTPAPAAPPSE